MESRTPDKVWAIFEEDHDHLLRILDRIAAEPPATVVAEEAGFADLLSRHFRDEEEILLPFLEQHGEDAEAVRRHVAEHLAILRLNEQVLEYARAGMEDLARVNAARLRLLLVQHVEHENESLYPEAEQNVSPGERGLIRNLVRSRRQQEEEP